MMNQCPTSKSIGSSSSSRAKTPFGGQTHLRNIPFGIPSDPQALQSTLRRDGQMRLPGSKPHIQGIVFWPILPAMKWLSGGKLPLARF